MGPLRAPSYLSFERCSSSGQTWPTPHRTVAAQAHSRGRRRSQRYLGVSPTPLAECVSTSSSTCASNGGSLSPRSKVESGAEDWTGWPCPQMVRSTAETHMPFPPSALLTDAQRKHADDAVRKLLHALQLNGDDSKVTRLLAGSVPATPAHANAVGTTALPGPISNADVAAAAKLLPPLTWHWLSVADLEGWVDRGVAHLLREALLVQRAATDVSASINELVGWCLDNCSGPAAALAAVWGQQQGQTLPPRCRSFYGLMLQRLGLSDGLALPHGQAPGIATSASGGCSGSSAHALQPAVVLCGSVTRTALSTSSRSRSSGDLEDEAETDDEASGGSGSAILPKGAGAAGALAGPISGAAGDIVDLRSDPDQVILGELPAAARAILEDSEGNDEMAAVGDAVPQRRQEQMKSKPPRAGRGLDGSSHSNGSSVGNGASRHINGSSIERNQAEMPALNGCGSSGSVASTEPPSVMSDGAAPAAATAAPTADAPLMVTAAPQGDVPIAADTAGATASPLTTGGAVTRPTASLLQRPSRSPVVVEPELDPGADTGAQMFGGTAAPGAVVGMSASSVSTSLGWLFRGAPAGLQQSYIPVRLVAIGRFPLRDALGAVLQNGLEVPETGPIVISNDPRVFAGTEAVLSDYATPAGEKLAIRLEYVVDRSSYNEVSLQLFNISRITRKRTRNCLMFVNGEPVNVGDPGVALVPGDEVWFGSRAFSFRIEPLQGPPSAVQEALQRFCDEVAGAGPGPQEDPSSADEGQPGVAAAASGFASDGETSSDEFQMSLPSSSLSSGPDMAELSNLSRRDPLRAEAALRRLAAANPGDAAVWLIWAQTAARLERPDGQGKARLLFRAAVEAARLMEVIPPPPAALLAAAQRAIARGGRGAARSGPAASRDDSAVDSMGSQAGPATGPEPQRHNWLLVQALGNWGKHEWRLRMYGSARHLFRAAVDEAARHPDGVAGGGGAAILHFWASRELDALNVRNARIVAAEALRKCPADVALYVLAAGVELEGGNLELAKSYCQRAYSLDRTDKQLFLIWPRVEAALGDRLKARLLYERALDMHPLNTKILNLYARFEAEEGSYREAAELYDRALHIDPLSPVMGVHNRADWASLEADLGNTGLARQLLEGGLEAHPRSAPLLVTLAKVERLEGRYTEALRLVRAAQTVAGAFNAPVMTERSQVLRALGEREMAANLARHVSAVKELNRMKQQGYWGSEAWRAFIEATRSAEQQALVSAARQRKLQLGWAPSVRGAKPRPTGEAGDGRRPAAPEAQQWMQMEQLRLRRAEARRLAAQRAAQMRALEEGGVDGAGAGVPGGSTSSGDDEYDDAPVGVPSLDSVRRPMPGYEDMYDT